LEIYVDLGRCICCHACEVACEREHGEPKISVEAVRDRASVPVSCHHCEVAPCALVCPSGALAQGASSVSFEAEKCTSCGLCIIACPFGAIYMDSTSTVQKCDLCPEREVPACILTCPTEAMIFGDHEDATKELRRRAAMKIAQSYAAAVGRERT
jgi:Fe-S-cluster-containing hydrogenase component 2